jgi:uncharacterized protein YndB with AHSA1/START domain
MATTTTDRTIAASADDVFDVVAHIEHFRKAVPHLLEVEFLSEQRRGVGARFRETRQMGKRTAHTTLEVTEYEPPSRVRLVSDEGGTVWDTVFTVRPTGGGSATLTMEMDARPHKLLAKLTVPLFKGMVAKAVDKDLDAIKAYCERERGAA